ncbi:hypothetical protein Ancab_017014, partial [Ancistrocladus abbreviatus]
YFLMSCDGIRYWKSDVSIWHGNMDGGFQMVGDSDCDLQELSRFWSSVGSEWGAFDSEIAKGMESGLVCGYLE